MNGVETVINNRINSLGDYPEQSCSAPAKDRLIVRKCPVSKDPQQAKDRIGNSTALLELKEIA